MANVKVKDLFENFFIKLYSLRRNKTWYKMIKWSLNLSYELSKNAMAPLVQILFF